VHVSGFTSGPVSLLIEEKVTVACCPVFRLELRRTFDVFWAVAYRGGDEGLGVQTPSPPKFPRPSKIVPNSTRLLELLKIAEFRTPTPQGVWKKGSKILKLPMFAIVLH